MSIKKPFKAKKRKIKKILNFSKLMQNTRKDVSDRKRVAVS